MSALIRPTQIQVMEAFHQHLADTGRHSATSKELADSKGWSLMEVSAALNQANARGTVIREGGTFRPAVSQIGRPIINLPAVAKPNPLTTVKVKGPSWPPDPEFVERYGPALASPDGPKAGLQREFGRPYGTIGYYATAVYRRLGLKKPTAQGVKPKRATADVLPIRRERAADRVYRKIEWPSDPEFIRRYEPALQAPTDVRGALEREFGCSYHSANVYATTVYQRLGLTKPSGAKGTVRKPVIAEAVVVHGHVPAGRPQAAEPAPVAEVLPPVDAVANTLAAVAGLGPAETERYFGQRPQGAEHKPVSSDDGILPGVKAVVAMIAAIRAEKPDDLEEFWSEYNEPGQPQEPPAPLDSPQVPESPSVAPSEPEDGKMDVVRTIGLALSAKVEENSTLFAKVKELCEANEGMWRMVWDAEETAKAKEAENADLWAKLRQADADLTERDELIQSLQEAADTLSAVVDHDKSERAKLDERLATCHRTIQNQTDRLAQVEEMPRQQITLTLTSAGELKIGVS